MDVESSGRVPLHGSLTLPALSLTERGEGVGFCPCFFVLAGLGMTVLSLDMFMAHEFASPPGDILTQRVVWPLRAHCWHQTDLDSVPSSSLY